MNAIVKELIHTTYYLGLRTTRYYISCKGDSRNFKMYTTIHYRVVALLMLMSCCDL